MEHIRVRPLTDLWMGNKLQWVSVRKIKVSHTLCPSHWKLHLGHFFHLLTPSRYVPLIYTCGVHTFWLFTAWMVFSTVVWCDLWAKTRTTLLSVCISQKRPTLKSLENKQTHLDNCCYSKSDWIKNKIHHWASFLHAFGLCLLLLPFLQFLILITFLVLTFNTSSLSSVSIQFLASWSQISLDSPVHISTSGFSFFVQLCKVFSLYLFKVIFPACFMVFLSCIVPSVCLCFVCSDYIFISSHCRENLHVALL